MKFSTRTRYGIRAMIEIASDTSAYNIFQKDIAKNQEISNKYLDHIISGLKAANLIHNVKGKKNGYILTKDASEISIFEIHNAFENGNYVIDCVNLNHQCEKSGKCKPQKFWKGLNEVVLDYFQSTTLQNILDYED